MSMTVEQALTKINQAQALLRDLDAGLRKAGAQDWADHGPHEMNVAGCLVRDKAWIDANVGLNEVYAFIRAHIDREVDEAMVDRAIEVWFDTGFKYAGEHKPRMKDALVAAMGYSYDAT